MDTIIYTILQFLAGGCAVYLVLSELYRQKNNFQHIWKIWKRFRFGMFLEVLVLALVVLSCCLALSKYAPYLKYGWLNLIIKSGGNIILAPVVAGVDSPYIILRIFPPIFLFGLILCVPFFAEAEEKIFRKGYHTWGLMLRQSIYFGLFHLVVGIPLSTALVLAIPGFFFACKYRSAFLKFSKIMSEKEARTEATLVSTTYHVMMNTLLIGYLMVLTILYI